MKNLFIFILIWLLTSTLTTAQNIDSLSSPNQEDVAPPSPENASPPSPEDAPSNQEDVSPPSPEDAPMAESQDQEDPFDVKLEKQIEEEIDRHFNSSKKCFSKSHKDHFKVYFGIINYLKSGEFPSSSDPYLLRSWGSWTISFDYVTRFKLSKKGLLNLGIGVNWDNYKFQNEKIFISQNNNQLAFVPDSRDLDFTKSKLTAFYINTFMIPTFGHTVQNQTADGDKEKSNFRYGAGPFVSYLLDSYRKQVYKKDGKRHKNRTHDRYYLNNLQYGVQVLIGYKEVDLFFKYSMKELFNYSDGPSLNAVSFGLVF